MQKINSRLVCLITTVVQWCWSKLTMALLRLWCWSRFHTAATHRLFKYAHVRNKLRLAVTVRRQISITLIHRIIKKSSNMLKYKRNIQKIKNLYYAASYGDGYFLNGQITALGASGQTELL